MIANLQLVRAAAAIVVVIFHTIIAVQDYGFGPDTIFGLRGWGFHGVDLFFVISGFVMVLIQSSKTRTASDFLINRIIRIAPAYWILTAAVFALILIAPGMFRMLTADWTVFIRSMTFTTFLSPVKDSPPLLYVGWTLEYEMLFYLIFAASFALRGWLKQFLFAFVLLTIFTLTNTTTSVVYEFLLGELCAFYYLSGRTIRHPMAVLALGVVGLNLPFLLPQEFPLPISENRALFFAIPSALVVLGAAFARQTSSRALIVAGDASYSIYLVQVLAIGFVCKLFTRVAPSTPAPLVAIATVGGTIFIGLLFHLYVEKPLAMHLQRLRTRLSRHQATIGKPVASINS
jgi:peptidoglycan/LPS O-acetylase OafA/YrhL